MNRRQSAAAAGQAVAPRAQPRQDAEADPTRRLAFEQAGRAWPACCVHAAIMTQGTFHIDCGPWYEGCAFETGTGSVAQARLMCVSSCGCLPACRASQLLMRRCRHTWRTSSRYCQASWHGATTHVVLVGDLWAPGPCLLVLPCATSHQVRPVLALPRGWVRCCVAWKRRWMRWPRCWTRQVGSL